MDFGARKKGIIKTTTICRSQESRRRLTVDCPRSQPKRTKLKIKQMKLLVVHASLRVQIIIYACHDHALSKFKTKNAEKILYHPDIHMLFAVSHELSLMVFLRRFFAYSWAKCSFSKQINMCLCLLSSLISIFYIYVVFFLNHIFRK